MKDYVSSNKIYRFQRIEEDKNVYLFLNFIFILKSSFSIIFFLKYIKILKKNLLPCGSNTRLPD